MAWAEWDSGQWTRGEEEGGEVEIGTRADKYPPICPLSQELTSLLRSMGQNPTDSEVHDMINEVDVDGSGVVEFEEFVQFIARLMRNSDPENEVRECYRR